ncbi:MAG: hypothetical protein OXI56_04590 [bacterium]|nr:hypothetical protein [bacterium]MDE0601055.1 hypothetical protein [bacterium]
MMTQLVTQTAVMANPADRRVPRTRSFSVELVPAARDGYSPGHEYVRLFWAAAIGRGATRDLLDLFLAGLRRRRIREPFYLAVLASAGLVQVTEGRIRMPSRVPPLPSSMLSRLAPHLRFDHRRWTPQADRAGSVGT